MLVKICGITCEKDLDYLAKARPDYAGMILFFPKSKRNISLERAGELRRKMPEGIQTVAVTVSPTVEQVDAIRDAGFSYLQVHGVLSGEVLERLDRMGHPEKMEVPDMRKLKLIRAFQGAGEEEIAEIQELQNHESLAAFLFDAKEPGSGRTFDWEKIPGRGILKKPFFLSGGLTPGNVRQAVRAVHPDGVDVSSGVELSENDAEVLSGLLGLSSLVEDSLYQTGHTRMSEISLKDSDKIMDFVKRARKAAEE